LPLIVPDEVLQLAGEEDSGSPNMTVVRLMTLDPGHFHAALVQKEMYPDVAKQAHVYAPLGPDLLAYLGHLAGFNARQDNPTAWQLEVHAGPDFLARVLRERPGNVVVLAGRNRAKIDRILAAVRTGLNVLADKPWILSAADLPKLESALNTAEAKGLIAYDIMTERFEITSILQREFVNDADTFGTVLPGSEQEPGVFMESLHYLMKTVAGTPLRRPASFFDVAQQGEGLTDVGTHLVDLVPWMLFPDQPLDYRQDVQVLAAQRWPTVLTRADFQRVTGEADFPDYLSPSLRAGQLDYYCNTRVTYRLRGIHTKLNILWSLEATTGGGDTHLAIVRGSRCRVEVRQGPEATGRPDLYLVPNAPADQAAVLAAARRKVAGLQARFPGLAVEDGAAHMRITIPDAYRVGHEAHFAQVMSRFLSYFQRPNTLPAWEKPNMLAKYWVTTKGLELSRQV
jgi:predicted dehydrogenase